MVKRLMVLVLALCLAVAFFGCEGEQGPEGPAGPQGEAGPMGDQGPQGEDGKDVPEYTYGGNSERCVGCHESAVEGWMHTHHAEAYEDLVAEGNETNLYCVKCHVTGFDAEVAYGDTEVTTPGPDMHGFDDYWPPETAEDSMRVEMLAGVGCESCHGPMGTTIYDHQPMVSYETHYNDGHPTTVCAKCHSQAGDDGTTEMEEWELSGHNALKDREGNEVMTIEEWREEHFTEGSCGACHSSEGFIARWDPDYAGWEPHERNLIGCVTCHDPHEANNIHHLRSVDDMTVNYDAEVVADEGTMTGYGSGQICAQCHQGRRDTDNVVGQIENGYAHFGPHHSNQGDMFLGIGSYEIEGYEYEREAVHQNLERGCVDCHMTMRGHGDPAGWKGGHDFYPALEACQGCHSGTDTFDVGGGQTEIEELMEQLITAIGVNADDLGDGDITTPEQRMAGYAYAFVHDDGSHGAHNPVYARSLLENAIDFISTYNAARDAGEIANK
ncbi:hypothetical protein K8I28_00210 [bacterium]|nr:hypothetical protein [bacterium]